MTHQGQALRVPVEALLLSIANHAAACRKLSATRNGSLKQIIYLE
jgi:hypothetical protein